MLRQLCVLVVKSRDGTAVGSNVLYAGCDFSLLTDIFTLKALHHGSRHLTIQVWVLPRGFHNPSPS